MTPSPSWDLVLQEHCFSAPHSRKGSTGGGIWQEPFKTLHGFVSQKGPSLVELSLKLTLVLNGSQSPAPGSISQSPKLKASAAAPSRTSHIGGSGAVRWNLASFPSSVLKRPGKARAEAYLPLVPRASPVPALHPAAAALRCPQGYFPGTSPIGGFLDYCWGRFLLQWCQRYQPAPGLCRVSSHAGALGP